MGLSDLVSLGTLNHWARADAANGTGAGMFAAYSTVQLGLEAYRRFGGSEGEDKTAQAKREFHEAVAEYVKGDKAFKKAAKPKQKVRAPSSSPCPSPAGFRTRMLMRSPCTAQDLLEKEVQRQMALLSIKLQLIGGAKPADLVVPKS